MAARRRAPLVAAFLVFAALTGMEQLGGATNTSLVGPYTSAFIVSYTIGSHLEGRALAVSWLVALVTALSLLDPNADEGLNLGWGWLVIVAAPVLAGRLLRDRARLGRELRTAAGVLRHEDDELALASQPALAHDPDLVRRGRAAGLSVALHVEGAVTPVSAGADLTVYRFVQEAPAGAVHEGGAAGATVTVRWRGCEPCGRRGPRPHSRRWTGRACMSAARLSRAWRRRHPI